MQRKDKSQFDATFGLYVTLCGIPILYVTLCDIPILGTVPQSHRQNRNVWLSYGNFILRHPSAQLHIIPGLDKYAERMTKGHQSIAVQCQACLFVWLHKKVLTN